MGSEYFLEYIFAQAAKAPKRDYHVYEDLKHSIAALNLTQDMYEKAIDRLTKILCV